MKCARGTSCHFSGGVVMYPRNTSPEKWVATKHHPCFGDDKQKAFSRFGDDMGVTSSHFSGDVVMYPRYTSPEKWVATEHHPYFGDGKWKTSSRFGDDI